MKKEELENSPKMCRQERRGKAVHDLPDEFEYILGRTRMRRSRERSDRKLRRSLIAHVQKRHDTYKTKNEIM